MRVSLVAVAFCVAQWFIMAELYHDAAFNHNCTERATAAYGNAAFLVLLAGALALGVVVAILSYRLSRHERDGFGLKTELKVVVASIVSVLVLDAIVPYVVATGHVQDAILWMLLLGSMWGVL